MNTWTKQMGFPLIYVEAEQVNLYKVLQFVWYYINWNSVSVTDLLFCTLSILSKI